MSSPNKKLNPQRRNYPGPYGDYQAGSVGAVLNALCEQEGRSCCLVGSYAIGNGKVFSNPTSTTVLATFVWEGDDIIFTWLPKAE